MTEEPRSDFRRPLWTELTFPRHLHVLKFNLKRPAEISCPVHPGGYPPSPDGIASRAAGYGIDAIRVDGNDPLMVDLSGHQRSPATATGARGPRSRGNGGSNDVSGWASQHER